jgi:DNA repair exonuclease SbcCD ATPase subunit
LSYNYGTIRRRYAQGLDSIVRFVTDIEDRIEDLTALHVSAQPHTIERQAQHIRQLQQTLDNKDAEIVQVHQLNTQLLAHIREIEKALEEDAAPSIERDWTSGSIRAICYGFRLFTLGCFQ